MPDADSLTSFHIKLLTSRSLCREGEEGDNFYVIERGQFKATKGSGDTTKLLCTYWNVGAFGELALMYNCTRAATVTVCLCASIGMSKMHSAKAPCDK